MSVVSLAFLVFLAVTLFVFYITPGKMQWWVLLAFSVIFYLYAGFEYFPFVVASTLIAYVSARAMERNFAAEAAVLATMPKPEHKLYRAKMKAVRRKMMTAGVVLVLFFLAFLKYYNFTVNNFDLFLAPLGLGEIPDLQLVLPLGISFYTFQLIAYLADVYRGKCKAQKNFAKFALYVLFFPQITEGPIARYNQLAPQLFDPKKINFDNLRFGAQLMVWGFFKKLVIADRIAPLVNTVYGNPGHYSGPVFILATLLFSIQIYADFSGCIDIVTGAAQMFGVKLAANFNHPYFSKTMPEFWRRWHISLCLWFKDYVFYPISVSRFSLSLNKHARALLGGKAGRIVASCFPVLVVWMLTGLWHGPTWNYVMWGTFHGVLIMLGIIFEPLNRTITQKLRINTAHIVWRLYQMGRTFLLCSIARVFFRSSSLPEAFGIFAKCFGPYRVPGGLSSLGMDRPDFAVAALGILILLIVSNLQEKMGVREKIAKFNLPVRWAFYLTAVFIVIVFGVYDTGAQISFIYEKF